MADRTTKLLLTIIAAALCVIAIELVPSAQAASPVVCRIEGPVQVENASSWKALRVEVKNRVEVEGTVKTK